MDQEKFISPFIASQFPSFYREEGPNFIAFVKAYYEWMEQTDPQWLGSTISQSRSIIPHRDIDDTLPEFVKYFKNKYIQALPESIIADKRLLNKHILDLYRSKGSVEAHKLLFRIFFNEDVEVYIPNEHIFAPSDATYHVPKYIEVSESPYLKYMVNKKIRSTSGATAVVEGYYQKAVKRKIVNVIYISNIDGEFQYTDKIYCDDIPEITEENAPFVVGSLSTITINNGGYDYSVGDYLNVKGAGLGGLVQVSSVRNENGKVKFTLVDGGYGYSVDAIVTVIGGYGSGATFKIGDLTDKQVYVLNSDFVHPVTENVKLEIYTEGFDIEVTDQVGGTFLSNEIVTCSGSSMHLYIDYVTLNNGAPIANGEILSNTAFGISGLKVYNSSENLLYVTGADVDLDYFESTANYYNLTPGNIILESDAGATVKVQAYAPRKTITGYGLVDGVNTSETNLFVYNYQGPPEEPEIPPLGYFVPDAIVTGMESGVSARVSTVHRRTDWQDFFPASAGVTNLDSQLGNTLRWVNKVIGKIAYLTSINPGEGYSLDPIVTVNEPLVAVLGKPDGKGGFWGNDAIVTAKAGSASGIVTSINISDSGFAYFPNENVILESNTNPAVVSGITVVDKQGQSAGEFKNRKGFLSDEMHLLDSYYYQTYSYELVARKMIKTYEKFVKDFTHPVGFMLFGKYSVKTNMIYQNSSVVDSFHTIDEIQINSGDGDGGGGDGGDGYDGGGDGGDGG